MTTELKIIITFRRFTAQIHHSNIVRLQLHCAIYRPDSFVLMLRYCVNLKAIRYESTSLNRIVADKSYRVIAALQRYQKANFDYLNKLKIFKQKTIPKEIKKELCSQKTNGHPKFQKMVFDTSSLKVSSFIYVYC